MDRVIVAFGPELLVLTADEFAVARQRGRELTQPEEVAASPASSGLVTAQDLARSLSLAKSAVYEYAKAGRIPSVRIGRHIRFDEIAVRKALRPTGAVSVGRR